jgi:hypothetical protein
MALINWTAGFEGTPAGSDPGSVIDDRIQELKEQIGRRLEQGGHILSDDPRSVHIANSQSARDGRHVVDAGGSGIGPDIYKSPTADADINTKLITYADTGAAMVAGSDWSGGNVTTGNDPGHGHHATLVIPLPATATGRVEGVVFENRGNGVLTLVDMRLICFTPPSGGTVNVDIQSHTVADATDPGTAGSSVIDPNTHPTIADGDYSGSVQSVFSDATLDVGDAWTFDIDAINGALDVSLVLKVLRA